MELSASKDEATGLWTLNGVESWEKTFKDMCTMLREGKNFKFSRYGDGEFFCMAGKIGKNCDQHEYFADLGQALNDAFYSSPNYMVGIQPLSVYGGLYQEALEFKPGPADIYNADVLHNASITMNLSLFIDAIYDRDVMLIGPGHISKMDKFFPSRWFLEIPDTNCWTHYSKIKNYLETFQDEQDVILLCASMMSEVLINDLKDLPCTIIDCGSVFDPYCDRLSRSYHHKLKLA